ncbi:MAG: hypothetical protein WKH64_07385 [Chloroflexia bacterium]
MLLLPQSPLIFQGQEFLASTPFLYFTDHEEELGALITEGRRKEFPASRRSTTRRCASSSPTRRPRRRSAGRG